MNGEGLAGIRGTTVVDPNVWAQIGSTMWNCPTQAKRMFSPMTSFTGCPKTSHTLPREGSERGGTRDGLGHPVKDVMGTEHKEGLCGPRAVA